jgi:hypothetical protein
MAELPVGVRPPARARPRAASPIAGILFVAAMGAAFWIGAIWASQAWWPVWR